MFFGARSDPELKAAQAQKSELSRDELREFLTEVILTPAGKVNERSRLCQSYKVTPEVREIRMPDKLRAVEQLVGKALTSFHLALAPPSTGKAIPVRRVVSRAEHSSAETLIRDFALKRGSLVPLLRLQVMRRGADLPKDSEKETKFDISLSRL